MAQSAAKDPYKVLGVSKKSSESEIKSAFRQLAKQHHPDRAGSDERAKKRAQEKFAEITQAYEILGDAQTKAKFDRGEIDNSGKERAPHMDYSDFGGNPFGRSSPFGSRKARPGGGFGGGMNPEDIIREMFGGGAASGGASHKSSSRAHDPFVNVKPSKRSQEPSKATLNVTLDQILADEKVDVSLADGRRVSVNIPTGTQSGETIRLKGQGEIDPTGHRSDLHLTVNIQCGKDWRVEGDNILGNFDVPLATAVRGGKVQIQTPKGVVALKIPAWSDGGKTFRMREKGMPVKGKSITNGDMIVTMRITLPTDKPMALETLLDRMDEQSK